MAACTIHRPLASHLSIANALKAVPVVRVGLQKIDLGTKLARDQMNSWLV